MSETASESLTRTVLLTVAALVLANTLFLSISLFALVVSERRSYGGPLVLVPLAFLLPTLVGAVAWAMVLAGVGAFGLSARLVTELARTAYRRVWDWRHGPGRDPFKY